MTVSIRSNRSHRKKKNSNQQTIIYISKNTKKERVNSECEQ